MRKTLALLSTLLLAAPVGSFASVSDDQVTSQKIKEADGTSGQNTNSGSGIKTNHIQNGAVTGAKIGAATITGANIGAGQITNALVAPNAVTTDKIQDGAVDAADLANGAVTVEKLATGAVGTAQIADGAVSDAKLLGSISASKINPLGLNADLVDGKHAADFAPLAHTHAQADVLGLEAALAGKADVGHIHPSGPHTHDAAQIVSGTLGVERLGTYQGLRIVHTGAADNLGTFNSVGAALASITDSGVSNRYAVVVMPGVYQEGGLSLPSYVALLGQGIGASVLAGGITLQSNSSVENLTVEGSVALSADSTLRGCAVVVSNGAGVGISAGPGTKVQDVRISGVGGYAMWYQMGGQPGDTTVIKGIDIRGQFSRGIEVDSMGEYPDQPLLISDVTITGTGIGIFIFDGHVRIHNATVLDATPAGGEYTSYALITGHAYIGGGVEVSSSRFESENHSIFTNCFLRVDNSELKGKVEVSWLQGGSMYIGSSRIEGRLIPGLPIKLVNCFNGSYDPLPNGPAAYTP